MRPYLYSELKEKKLKHSTRSISNIFAIVQLELIWPSVINSILDPPTKTATHLPSQESILDLTYQIKTSIIAYCKASDKYFTLIFPQQINTFFEIRPA